MKLKSRKLVFPKKLGLSSSVKVKAGLKRRLNKVNQAGKVFVQSLKLKKSPDYKKIKNVGNEHQDLKYLTDAGDRITFSGSDSSDVDFEEDLKLELKGKDLKARRKRNYKSDENFDEKFGDDEILEVKRVITPPKGQNVNRPEGTKDSENIDIELLPPPQRNVGNLKQTKSEAASSDKSKKSGTGELYNSGSLNVAEANLDFKVDLSAVKQPSISATKKAAAKRQSITRSQASRLSRAWFDKHLEEDYDLHYNPADETFSNMITKLTGLSEMNEQHKNFTPPAAIKQFFYKRLLTFTQKGDAINLFNAIQKLNKIKFKEDAFIDYNQVLDKTGSSLMSIAAAHGDDSILLILYGNTNIEVSKNRNQKGHTALSIACHYGKLSSVILLMSFGAQTTERNNKNESCLVVAANRIATCAFEPDYMNFMSVVKEIIERTESRWIDGRTFLEEYTEDDHFQKLITDKRSRWLVKEWIKAKGEMKDLEIPKFDFFCLNSQSFSQWKETVREDMENNRRKKSGKINTLDVAEEINIDHDTGEFSIVRAKNVVGDNVRKFVGQLDGKAWTKICVLLAFIVYDAALNGLTQNLVLYTALYILAYTL